MSTAAKKIMEGVREFVEHPRPENVTSETIRLRSLADIIAERRAPRWLLHKILERDVLAILAGARGTFKSFIALEWAMRVALSGEPALILSGEGAGLGMRAEAWLKEHAPNLLPKDIPIVALERPLMLTVAAEMEALSQAISAYPKKFALIILDTWSKFSAGLDENSNSEVAGFLLALSRELRERFGCTILIVAHTGHNENGRPRGASALTANTDCELIVTRSPLDMAVSISRERYKDTPSLPPLGYEARAVDLGRTDEHGEPVTSLALLSVDAPVRSAKGTGKNQLAAMTALREWARANSRSDLISSPDMGAILKTQGIGVKRKPEALNWLCNAGILTPSIGGYLLNKGVL